MKSCKPDISGVDFTILLSFLNKVTKISGVEVTSFPDWYMGQVHETFKNFVNLIIPLKSNFSFEKMWIDRLASLS